MAFPTLAATNQGSTPTGNTTHTINLPAGISSGDLLIAFFTVDGAPGISGWPSGWTALDERTHASNKVSWAVRYKIADGTEGASFNLTTSVEEGSTHRTYRITGWHGTTPPEIAAVETSGYAVNIDPPSLSPSWGSADNLWIAAAGHDDGADTYSVFPTNYINTHEQNQNPSGSGTGTCTRELAGASEDPSVFTLNSEEQQIAATIAVRPAGAPPAGIEVLRRRREEC